MRVRAGETEVGQRDPGQNRYCGGGGRLGLSWPGLCGSPGHGVSLQQEGAPSCTWGPALGAVSMLHAGPGELTSHRRLQRHSTLGVYLPVAGISLSLVCLVAGIRKEQVAGVQCRGTLGAEIVTWRVTSQACHLALHVPSGVPALCTPPPPRTEEPKGVLQRLGECGLAEGVS